MNTAVKYPIAAEKYIAAMRIEFGPDKAAEEAHRVIIPFVNDAYAAGLAGEGGFPLNLDEARRVFAEAASMPIERARDDFLITGIVQWANEAYVSGCKDSTRQ